MLSSKVTIATEVVDSPFLYAFILGPYAFLESALYLKYWAQF